MSLLRNALTRRIKAGVVNRVRENDTLRRWVSETGEISYSQCGEDRIVAFLFDQVLRLARPTYLDIGAHHATFLSNTYLFYKRGLAGVCVEPDPGLCAAIQARRKRDVCLNVGIGAAQQDAADFYVMSSPAYNTFSEEEAKLYDSLGQYTIKQIIRVPLLPINDLIAQHFAGAPDFLSLDVEGLDLEILKTLDFSRRRPRVLCVETLSPTEDGEERKVTETIDFVQSQEYMLYADTFINSLFVDRQAWANRPRD